MREREREREREIKGTKQKLTMSLDLTPLFDSFRSFACSLCGLFVCYFVHFWKPKTIWVDISFCHWWPVSTLCVCEGRARTHFGSQNGTTSQKSQMKCLPMILRRNYHWLQFWKRRREKYNKEKQHWMWSILFSVIVSLSLSSILALFLFIYFCSSSSS